MLHVICKPDGVNLQPVNSISVLYTPWQPGQHFIISGKECQDTAKTGGYKKGYPRMKEYPFCINSEVHHLCSKAGCYFNSVMVRDTTLFPV